MRPTLPFNNACTLIVGLVQTQRTKKDVQLITRRGATRRLGNLTVLLGCPALGGFKLSVEKIHALSHFT
ncbi:hypothetical protein CYMTET_21800 [Cymbomonas tetramitiformis]|uniref:Uncharacterized protein n=1 Tax=Cymbomonas tetramitiformis TaxID=36881 RepID=A0AAE0G1G0_9CHLO|nr:hypothetical protein CYMTET_21800 [Cymbomonas tetramitiformis]